MALSDKTRKRVLIVFSLFTIVAFALPSYIGGGASGRSSGGSAARAKMLDGTVTITGQDMQQAEYEWKLLKNTLWNGIPGLERPIPLTVRLAFGDPASVRIDRLAGLRLNVSAEVARQIDADPSLFLVLAREAEATGIRVSDDQVEGVIVNEIVGSDRLSPQERVYLRLPVRRLLEIEAAARRAVSTVKVSAPLRRMQAAENYQKLTVEVAYIPAAEFSKAAPEPTDAELAEQFVAFGNKPAPGTAAAEAITVDRKLNPFGFGYQVPEAIRFQYVGASWSALLQAAKAAQDDYAWEVAARKYYQQNREQYRNSSTTATPADAYQAYDSVKASVIDLLQVRAAEALRDKVRSRIGATLAGDYQQWSAVKAKTPAAASPASSLGAAYDTPGYLSALADKVKTETGVSVDAQRADDRDRTPEEIGRMTSLLGGIGKAKMLDESEEAFADFAARRLKPLREAAGVKDGTGVALWAPAGPFQDDAGGIYVARFTAASPRKLADDRGTVEPAMRADLKTVWGLGKAREMAVELAASARDRGLRAAAQGARRDSKTLADLTTAPGSADMTLSEASRQMLIQGAFAMLKPSPLPGNPVAVIDLAPDAKVAVAELLAVMPGVPGADAGSLELEAASEMRGQLELNMLRDWMRKPNILARTGYKDLERTTSDKPTGPTTAP